MGNNTKIATYTILSFFAVLIVGLVMVLPLMWLWNYVMPPIFGLPEISYLQMLALYYIVQFLFRTNITVNKK